MRRATRAFRLSAASCGFGFHSPRMLLLLWVLSSPLMCTGFGECSGRVQGTTQAKPHVF